MGRFLGSFALAASLAALASLAPGSPVPSSCAAAGTSHAALVVEHGDGSAVTRCVAFDAGQVTGEQLLNASGVSWSGQTFGGFGVAVCAMDGEPARYSSCPGSDGYWAVFVARGQGPWQLSNVGISTLTLADGDAEGFRFVPSPGNPVAPPLPVGVCAAASPGPTATATAAPVATPTRAPAPAATVATVATPAARRTAASSDLPTAVGSATTASSAAADAPLTAVAGTTASAGPGESVSVIPAPAAARTPSAPGPDLGLLAAALAGGGLGGLALLRLLALRRPGP